jgi:DNA-binding NarL/FixJ family response regulator
MRVLLVDDHALFLEGLHNLLVARGHEVLATADDGFEALALARALQPDVILMDIEMPRCNGLQATRLIKAELPEIKIVMLTVSANDDDLFEAIKSGASGYLLKNLKAHRFFELLDGVAQGEAPISPTMAAKILHEFAHRQKPHALAAVESAQPGLTTRQIEVLKLVVDGQAYKEIAATLSITERTVKYHMREILQTLHVQNRTQAVALALKTGLITSEPEQDT